MSWLSRAIHMLDHGTPVFAAEGVVVSGLGRGAHFVGLDWVQRELRQQLSLVPYPGTLNLRVEPEAFALILSRRDNFLRIADAGSPECAGFLQRVTLRANGREYSSAYLILAEKTEHRDVIEIIAPDSLRGHFSVNDGDRLSLEELLPPPPE